MARLPMEAPFPLVDREDLSPVCPDCGAETNEVYRKAERVSASALTVARCWVSPSDA